MKKQNQIKQNTQIIGEQKKHPYKKATDVVVLKVCYDDGMNCSVNIWWVKNWDDKR